MQLRVRRSVPAIGQHQVRDDIADRAEAGDEVDQLSRIECRGGLDDGAGLHDVDDGRG
jgi:hypothetical protein